MRRYEIVHILARRLNMKVGRVQAILSKLQEAGVISGSGLAKRAPDDLAEPEIVNLLIALLAESGIATGPAAAETFGALTATDGTRFDAFLSEVLFGPPLAIRHLFARQSPPGVSVVVGGQHILFGQPASATTASPARTVPGEALGAITAELRGESPATADALAAIQNIRKSA